VIDGVLSSSFISADIPHWISIVLRQHRSRLLDCRIDSLEHRKNEEGAKHEYIQLALQCTGRSGMRYSRHIRIDRSFQRNPSCVKNHYRTLLRGGGLPADDTVIITPTPYRTGSFSLYAAYFHDDQRPTILDLAAVLQAVTSLAPMYDLYAMCYWHARMSFDGLAFSFQGRIMEAHKPSSRGKFGNLKVTEQNGRLVLTCLKRLPSWSRNFLELPTLPMVLERVAIMRAEISEAEYLTEPREVEVAVEQETEMIAGQIVEVYTSVPIESINLNLYILFLRPFHFLLATLKNRSFTQASSGRQSFFQM